MKTQNHFDTDRAGLGDFLRKLLCLLLALSMVMPWTLTAQAVESADGQSQTHTEHTPECGYRAATPGAPCRYDTLCDKECKDTDGDGIPDHARDCAYTLELQKELCDKGCKDTDSDGLTDHAPDCAFTLAKGKHTHNASCGYIAPDEGAPCAFQTGKKETAGGEKSAVPQPSEGDVVPQPPEGENIPEPSEGEVTPEPSEGDVTPEPSEGEVTPEPSEGEVTPEPSEGEVTPEPSEGNVVPEPSEGEVTPEPSEGEVTPEPSEGEVTPEPSEGEVTPEPSEGEVTPEPSEGDVVPQPSEETPVQQVQALIDALPEADTITAENAGEVTARLAAIDAARAELTQEEQDGLDITRYMAAAGAVSALEGTAGDNEIQTLEETGYHFNLKFTNIPSGVTVTFIIYDENGNPVVTGTGDPIQYTASILPIRIEVVKGGQSMECRLYAPGDWTFTYNTDDFFDRTSWSHDHELAGETGSWKPTSDYRQHFLDYGCDPFGYNSEWEDHKFDDKGICTECKAEKPVYTVYFWPPEGMNVSELVCVGKDGTAIARTMDFGMHASCFYLPSSFQGPIYFQSDTGRIPEKGTLELTDQGTWYYNGDAGEWKQHTGNNHVYLWDGAPCALCGKVEEYSAYELYADLPNMSAETNLSCFVYRFWEDNTPVLTFPMEYKNGYWYCEFSTNQTFEYLALASDTGLISGKQYVPYKEAAVQKLVYKGSLEESVYKGSLEDHDDRYGIHHFHIDGVCVVCGEVQNYAAEVNGIRYATLKEAWDAAIDAYDASTGTPVTITLLSDVTVTENLELSRGKIVLEGGGYTVSFAGGNIRVWGELTLNSGIIENANTDAVIVYGSFIMMNGGAIKTTNASGVSVNGTFTMNGGAIESKGDADGTVGIKALSGNVTIFGGSVYGDECGVLCDGAAVAISGGDFDGKYNNGNGLALYVSSGTNDNVKLSGGTFSRVKCKVGNVGELLAADHVFYESQNNKTYTVDNTKGNDTTEPTKELPYSVVVREAAATGLDFSNRQYDVEDTDEYRWDGPNRTLTLKAGCKLEGNVILPEGTVNVIAQGECSIDGNIEVKGYDTKNLVFGGGPLCVTGQINGGGANEDTITIAQGANVTAEGGVVVSASGSVGGRVIVRGTLNAVGYGNPAILTGNVDIEGGTLNVSGAEGVKVSGTGGSTAASMANALLMNGGEFNGTCTNYNVALSFYSYSGSVLTEAERDNVFQSLIEGKYIPNGYSVQLGERDGNIVVAIARDNTPNDDLVNKSGIGGSLTMYAGAGSELYTVTVRQVDGGTAAASRDKAEASVQITMTAVPADGCHLEGWTVVDEGGNQVKITRNTFTMPASNVTVTPIFAPNIDLYSPDMTITVLRDSRVYNGQPQTPVVNIQYKDTDLIRGRDYTLSYSNNKNAGTAGKDGAPTITIIGIGSYQGTVIREFTIAPKKLTAEVTAENKVYDGNTDATVNVTITTGVYNEDYEDETLEIIGITGTFVDKNVGDGKTVTINIPDNPEVITGGGADINNYLVEFPETATANITLAQMGVSAVGHTGTYDTQPHGITVTPDSLTGTTIKYGETDGTYNLEASPTYSDVGNHTVYYEVTNPNYETVTGSATVEITIKTVTPTIVLSPDSFTYDGTEKTPTVTVKDGNDTISAEEYQVGGNSGINQGEYTVTVSDNNAGGNYAINTATKKFTIEPASIIGADVTVNESYTYNGTAHTPTGDSVTVTLGGEPLVQGRDYTLSSYSGNVNAGTDTATVTVTGTGNYKDTAVGHFTIKKAPLTIKANGQTITFGGSIATGVGQVTVTGLAYGDTLESVTLNPSTENCPGGTITPDKAKIKRGEMEVTDNYAIDYQKGNLTINKFRPTIAFKDYPISATYSGTALADPRSDQLTITGAQYGDVIFSWTLGGEKATPRNAGTYKLTATIPATDNTEEATATQNVTIDPKNVTVTITAADKKTYDGEPLQVTAELKKEDVVGNDQVNVTLTYTRQGDTDPLDGAPTDAGSYTVTASVGNKNYQLASAVSKNFIIEKAEPNLTVSGSFSKTYGDDDFDLDAEWAGDGTISYTNYDQNVITVDVSGKVHIVGAGKTTITVMVAGTDNYNPSETKTVDVEVIRASTSLSAESIPEKTYGDESFQMKYHQSVPGTVEFSSSDPSVATVDPDGNVTIVGKGSAEITLSMAETDNYSASSDKVTLTVKAKKITVTITPKGGEYGGKIDAATAVLNDLESIDAQLTATLTYTGKANDGTEVNSTTAPTLAGTYTVTASIPEGNYILTGKTSEDFIVKRADSGLTVTDVGAKTYGDEDFPLTVKQTGDGKLTYASDNESVATVDETGKVHIVAAGKANIKVTVAETDNYAAKTVEVPVDVAKRKVKVTVDSKTMVYGDPVPELTYTVEKDALVGTDTLKVGLTVSGKDAGTYEITDPNAAKNNPNYEITFEKGQLTVEARKIDDAQVVLGPALIASGKPQAQTIQSVTVKDSQGKRMEVTYTITDNTQTAAGGYQMTITGTGNFTGTKKQSFAIAPALGQPVDTDGSGNPVLGNGKITVQVRQGAGTPDLRLSSAKVEIIEHLTANGTISAQELAQVVDGENLEIIFTVSSSASVSSEDQSKIKALTKGYTVGSCLDISLSKQLGDGEAEPVTMAGGTTRLTVQVPKNLLSTKKNEKRTYQVVRCHDGKAEFLETTFEDGKLTFETDRFSSYAIVYTVKKLADPTSPRTGDSFHLELWLTVMLISAAGIGTLATVNRKKKQ